MWFWKRKEEAQTALCFIFTLVVCSMAFLFCKFVLPSGGRAEYYVYSASSQAEISDGLKPEEFFILEGESITYQTEDGSAFADELVSRFRARVQSKESVCGVLSYYCYSPVLSSFVVVGGEKINLHIAVRENEVKVGTPLIFGGF